MVGNIVKHTMVQECARLVTELLCIGPANGVNPGVLPLVKSLGELYFSDDPPPVQILRHPRVRPCSLTCVPKYSNFTTILYMCRNASMIADRNSSLRNLSKQRKAILSVSILNVMRSVKTFHLAQNLTDYRDFTFLAGICLFDSGK